MKEILITTETKIWFKDGVDMNFLPEETDCIFVNEDEVQIIIMKKSE